MQKNNPLIIPRNHKVEESLQAASEKGDIKPLNDLLKYLKKPYEDQLGISHYQALPEFNEKKYVTFCGT